MDISLPSSTVVLLLVGFGGALLSLWRSIQKRTESETKQEEFRAAIDQALQQSEFEAEDVDSIKDALVAGGVRCDGRR